MRARVAHLATQSRLWKAAILVGILGLAAEALWVVWLGIVMVAVALALLVTWEVRR